MSLKGYVATDACQIYLQTNVSQQLNTTSFDPTIFARVSWVQVW